ncbi:hypothetical protein [Methylocystis sp.]|uniref:hypothetical protein n=1 Tax=Methylocystis sp. TaxID=1911079 RepID=UPI003DA20E01
MDSDHQMGETNSNRDCEELQNDRVDDVLDGDQVANSYQQTGFKIVRKAIQALARQIVDNAGDDGTVVVGKLLGSAERGFDRQPLTLLSSK